MKYLYPMPVILIMLLSSCSHKPSVQVTPSTIQITLPSNSPVVIPHDPPAACAVTQPPIPAFIPPAPYSARAPFEGEFWYGSDSLWTSLPSSGSWPDLPQDARGYSQKIFLWRKGYSVNSEPRPKLSIAGERLDPPPLTFTVSGGTNAFAEDIGEAMLIGVDFPSLGCWKITGKYGNAELIFVIRVTP
jgi:hypothetical protein